MVMLLQLSLSKCERSKSSAKHAMASVRAQLWRAEGGHHLACAAARHVQLTEQKITFPLSSAFNSKQEIQRLG